ncbi:hypothetical protein [Salinibacter ruber]|uniref:hypothetical protein n=1 Tax=Salinibacter ruber TaxID=146919 RepID=UPI0020739704|nr:hypothetical protein [Salinibacter ruber]MCS3758182.1 hypothetical protein [Salinibacter ruber]MCS3954835.1 hypothetical protein [Salinibacter ruber]
MKRWILALALPVLLAMTVLTLPESTWAQTGKVLQRKDMHGQSTQTPYISHSEYKGISIKRQGPSGKSFKKSTDGLVLGAILSVSSLGEIVSVLGEPESIDRNVFPDGERFIATLEYGGMTLVYAKRKDGNVKLTTLEMKSSDWLIEVGGTELQPGMRIDQLSPAVQQSINGDTFLGEDDVDGVGVIRVAEKGKAKEGNVKLMEGGQPQVSVHVNGDTETIKVVRFYRIV